VAEKPASEKTEKPTYRRLQKAKKDGQVAHSEELPAAASILVLILVLVLVSPAMLNSFILQMREGMSGEISVFADSGAFIGFFNKIILNSVLIVLPVFAALAAGSIASCIVVSGLNFSSKPVVPNFDAVNPVKGFGKLFNVKSIVKLGISIAKLIFISIIVWKYLQGRIEELAAIRWAWTAQIVAAIAKIIYGMLLRISVAILIIAALDVLFQKWKYIKDLMMTKQEIKQERRDSDGSPELKSRLRRIQIDMAKKRMLQEIPKANVVLVNPTHVAVALRYDPKTMEAPIMVAKGADHIAEKIREIARAYGVPIIRRPELARTIYSSVKKPGDPIPQKLYAAVAEILAMIYRLKRRGA